MIRKASKMRVYPKYYEEYQKRHDELWPEMHQLLKEHGVHNYSIFLDEESGSLFAYVEVESEAKWEAIAKTQTCQKWWDYMKDIMEVNEDNSPKTQPLEAVFYLK